MNDGSLMDWLPMLTVLFLLVGIGFYSYQAVTGFEELEAQNNESRIWFEENKDFVSKVLSQANNTVLNPRAGGVVK